MRSSFSMQTAHTDSKSEAVTLPDQFLNLKPQILNRSAAAHSPFAFSTLSDSDAHSSPEFLKIADPVNRHSHERNRRDRLAFQNHCRADRELPGSGSLSPLGAEGQSEGVASNSSRPFPPNPTQSAPLT
jgi:hypothetical protein